MKKLLVATALIIGSVVQAEQTPVMAPTPIPTAVYKAAKVARAEEVRTVIVKTAGDNPCDGGYAIKIQVRKPYRVSPDSFDVAYTWETVKELSASADGSVIDICLE